MTTKKYKVLLPIGYGGRQEKGTIIDMDTDTAKAFGPEYVKEVSGNETEAQENTSNEKSLDEMSLPELKAKAKAMNLAVGGSKADLVERISLALDKSEEDESEEEAE